MCEIMKEIKKVLLELSISQKETDRQMKEVQKELWWIWNSQEEVGIDLFKINMKGILARRWVNIDRTSTKFYNDVKLENWEIIKWEYDLMWINWQDIVVVEVKNKLKNDHIKKILKTQLPKFKLLFPQYKDYNLYWWVWSLIVWEDEEKLAEKNWLFVFTQGKDWNVMIANKPNFKAKVF